MYVGNVWTTYVCNMCLCRQVGMYMHRYIGTYDIRGCMCVRTYECIDRYIHTYVCTVGTIYVCM